MYIYIYISVIYDTYIYIYVIYDIYIYINLNVLDKQKKVLKAHLFSKIFHFYSVKHFFTEVLSVQ